MGTQKVPGIVVLHCTGTTYGNAYLIALKVEPLCSRSHTHTHTHTHTLTHTHSLNPAIVGSTGGRHLSESSRVLSLEAKSGGHGGWVMTEMFFSAGTCRTRSDVRLGTLSWRRSLCPCLPLVAPLPPNCIAQPLQNLHVKMTSTSNAIRAVQTHGASNSQCRRIPWTFWLPLKVNQSYPRNRPWRPIRLWDVKDPTLPRQSAHRWW
jgi:hypothetical protein